MLLILMLLLILLFTRLLVEWLVNVRSDAKCEEEEKDYLPNTLHAPTISIDQDAV